MTTPFHPLVSIVIPVYNGADYLAEAIESALAQTYDRIEIIVVDDGSCDDGATRRIAHAYGTRIRYIHQENGGCGAALNTGIAAMHGDYFSWLSHDDLYPADKVALQVGRLTEREDRTTMLFGNYELIDSRGSSLQRMRIEDLGTRTQLDTPLYALTHGCIHGCTLLVARQLFGRHGMFNASLKATQDYDLWFRMMRDTPVCFMPECLTLSRVHERQGSKNLPEVVPEGEALWARFIEEVSPSEAAAMDGSHQRYLQRLARFLENTPYARMAPVAEAKARNVPKHTSVSVIIPFRDRVEWTLEALHSALAQTHTALEILLIDDGSTEDVTVLRMLAEQHAQVHYHCQTGAGPGAARNYGVRLASCDYVAFLDSDDLWEADKVQRQLEYMELHGLAFSHTNYRRFSHAADKDCVVSTAHMAGRVYPAIIAGCPIATPTVMARTDLLRAYPFPEDVCPGEDVIAWTGIAREHEIGALDEALTRVRISELTTSASPERVELGLLNILGALIRHPEHSRQHNEILALIDLLQSYERLRAIVDAPRHAPDEARHSPPPQRPRLTLHLLRIGLASLRRNGIRATWKRTLRWYRLRGG